MTPPKKATSGRRTQTGSKKAAKKASAARKGKGRPKRKDPAEDLPAELWERQLGESAEAFAAFALYRDLGPDGRSVRKTARSLGKSGSLVSRWSADHAWPSRAAAWDLETDRHAQAELRADQIEARRRHAMTLKSHLQASELLTIAFLEKVADNPEILKNMDADQLAGAMIRAARVAPRLVVAERLTLGISTENIAQDTPTGVAEEQARQMSDEELDRFLESGDVASLDQHRERKAAG